MSALKGRPPAPRPSTSEVAKAVYHGQTRIGSILKRGEEFVARDNLNRPLGVFDTMIEASAAVSKAAVR
jgi:hypothetical protein